MNKALEDYPGEVFSVACNVTELITLVIEMQVNAQCWQGGWIPLWAEAQQIDRMTLSRGQSVRPTFVMGEAVGKIVGSNAQLLLTRPGLNQICTAAQGLSISFTLRPGRGSPDLKAPPCRSDFTLHISMTPGIGRERVLP